MLETTLPTFAQLYELAPYAALTLIIAFAGWWMAMKSSQRTLDIMKEFIEYLKGKK